MESAILGLILDSNILIAAERANLTPLHALLQVRAVVGEVLPVGICSLTIAELAHGIYRAKSSENRERRRLFVDQIKANIPVHNVTAETAEIIARVGGEQAAMGINIPLGDLIIGAAALERGYAVATNNLRDFNRIPGLTVIKF